MGRGGIGMLTFTYVVLVIFTPWIWDWKMVVVCLVVDSILKYALMKGYDVDEDDKSPWI